MTTSKLTRMAFSHHSRYSASDAPARCVGTPGQEKRATGPRDGLLGALLRKWRTHRLLQEKKRVWASFCRVSAALGLRSDRQQQTAEQSARLTRIRQIEQQLRTLNYTDL